MIKFQSPEYFYLLIILPIVFYAQYYFFKKRQKLIREYFTKNNYKLVGTRLKKAKVFTKILLITIVFFLIICALARPQYGYKEITIAQNGQNIFIALDVSLSMRAQDVPPSRLELAKRKIIDFVKKLKGERVSLICFAGVPFINIPLTTDYSIFPDYMQIVDTDLIPVQGTDFYKLIEKVVDVVKRKSLNNVDILILSDGEDFGGNIEEALKLCKKYKIRIFSIGIGTNHPVPIKLKDGSLKKDKNGNIVMTSLNEDFLKKISLATGGIYIKGVVSSRDIDAMYKEISKSFIISKQTEKKREYINRFKWFVMPAFILLCIYFLIDERKVPVMMLIFLFASINLNAANPYFLNKKGIDYYNKKDYLKALKNFNKAYKSDKNKKFLYNKALSLYKLGKKNEALKIFSSLTNDKNNDLKEKSFYNKGVIYYKLKQYKKALENFKKALKINPNDYQARIDYELTLKKLKKSKNSSNQKKQNKEKNKRKQQNKNKNRNKKNKSQNKRNNLQNKKRELEKKELEKLLNLYNEKNSMIKQMIKRKLKSYRNNNIKDW